MKIINYKGHTMTVRKDLRTRKYECVISIPYNDIEDDYTSEYEWVFVTRYRTWKAVVLHLRELRRVL